MQLQNCKIIYSCKNQLHHLNIQKLYQKMMKENIQSVDLIHKTHNTQFNLLFTIKQHQTHSNQIQEQSLCQFRTLDLDIKTVKKQEKNHKDQHNSIISQQRQIQAEEPSQKFSSKITFVSNKIVLIFILSFCILFYIYFQQVTSSYAIQSFQKPQVIINQNKRQEILQSFQVQPIVKKQFITGQYKIQHRNLQEQFQDINEQKQLEHFQKAIMQQIYHVSQKRIVSPNVKSERFIKKFENIQNDNKMTQGDFFLKNKFQQNKIKEDVQKFRFPKTNSKPFQQIIDTIKFWKMTGNNISQNKELQEFQELQKNYYQNKYQISKYKEVEICVVVLSYMNKADDRYKRNLNSIFQQDYTNYKVYYVDDNSQDKTGELVQNYIKDYKVQDKIKLYRNNQRMGKSYNQFYVSQQNCKPGSVMVVLDGDDELIGKQVFKFLSAAYQMTGSYYIYTNFLMIDPINHSVGIGFSVPFSQETIQTRNYRRGLLPSHLRTWMSDLFLDIKKQDLFINGTFPSVGQDVGTSFQLLQKAGTKVTFFSQFVHRYVVGTGLNDYALNRNGQTQADLYYRKMPKFDTYNKTITLNIQS